MKQTISLIQFLNSKNQLQFIDSKNKLSDGKRLNPKLILDESRISTDLQINGMKDMLKRNIAASQRKSKFTIQVAKKKSHNKSQDISHIPKPDKDLPVIENTSKSTYHFHSKTPKLQPILQRIEIIYAQRPNELQNYVKFRASKRNLSSPHQINYSQQETNIFTAKKTQHLSDFQSGLTKPFSTDMAQTHTHFSDIFPTQPGFSLGSNYQHSQQSESGQMKFRKIETENPQKIIQNLFFPVEGTQEAIKDNLKQVYTNDYDFYKHTKNFSKINQVRDLYQANDEHISPFEGMLKQCEKQNFFPRKLNLINKYQEPTNEIKNSHFRMGDQKAKIFSHGIREFKEHIENINLSNNNLTDLGGSHIMSAIGFRTKTIDLSQNKLHKSQKFFFPQNNFESNSAKDKTQLTLNLSKLSQRILDHHFSLKEINLSGNNLGDQNIQVLLQTLAQYGSQSIIQKFDISKNYLTEKSATYIKEFLINSQDILEIYLGWNNLGKEGSSLIAQGVLDVKYCNLGACEDSTREWVKVFEKDEELGLIHLDLSFNNFSLEESKILAEGIFNNHSITGFHFRGNHGNVDCKGFIKIPTEPLISVNNLNWQIKSNIDGVKVIGNVQSIINCWICEGFEEESFFWKPHISGNISTEPILIHFSFDNFEPHQMVKEDNIFKFSKMCPPNEKILYFFTIQGTQWYSKEKNIKIVEVNEPDVIVPYADVDVKVHVQRMNVKQTQRTSKVVNSDYKPLFDLKPRFYESINYLVPEKQIKIPWTWENSIFKDYRKEDENFLTKCFEKDLTDSRIEKVIKPEEYEQAKVILRQYYKQLKSVYKHYASASPSGEVWSIGQNVYIEFMNNSKLSQNFPQSQISLNFVNTNAGNVLKRSQSSIDISNNPSNSLVRFQFLEVLVRNITDKYIKSNISQTFNEAFKQALDDGLQDELDKCIDESEWRENQFWSENSEIVILKYKNLIERLFKIYAGLKKQQNTKIKFMSFDDFKAFNTEMQLGSEGVADRDVNLAYNLAMMGQINELSSSKHIQMKLIEFWEALARIADGMNLIPYGITEEDQEFFPLEIRAHLEISIKLESLLVHLWRKQDNYFRQDNPLTEVSLFSEELQAIKNGKQVAQRARKNVQNKVKALLKRRQSQSLKRGGIISILGALKKSGALKLSDNLAATVLTPKSNEQTEDLLQLNLSPKQNSDDSESDMIKEEIEEGPPLKKERANKKSKFQPKKALQSDED